MPITRSTNCEPLLSLKDAQHEFVALQKRRQKVTMQREAMRATAEARTQAAQRAVWKEQEKQEQQLWVQQPRRSMRYFQHEWLKALEAWKVPTDVIGIIQMMTRASS
jgi:hypothetical protein